MPDSNLSAEERAELEALRAEKAAREKRAAEAAERAELERLRAEQAAARAEEQAEARDAALRERNRAFMEPDEDLNMPAGQKLVLAAIALLVIVFIVYTVLGV